METEYSNSCSICFEDFTGKETSRPDVCDHVFCLQCLQRWGKFGSFCPIDRKRFKKIINLSTSTQIPIKPKKRKKQQALYDVSSYCEVCAKVEKNDTLILCDCCDLGYHLVCLKPPLSEVPPGVWHCPVCVAVAEKIRSKRGITKDVENIVREHTHLSPSTSSESSLPETNHTNNQSSNQEIDTSSLKPKKRLANRISRTEPPFKRRQVRRTRSNPDKEITREFPSESTVKLRSLRPRHQIEKAQLFDWSNSSDESQSAKSNDSSTSTKKLPNHYKKSLRPRHLLRKRILNDIAYDSSDTSNSQSLDGEEKSSVKSTSSVELPHDFAMAPPEFEDFITKTSDEKKNDETDFVSETFPVSCSPSKATPQASIVSPETASCETNDLAASNICIISACSLNNCEDASYDEIKNADVAVDVSVLNSEKKSLTSSSYLPETQMLEDDDEISVIATVVKESLYKPIAKEELEDFPNSSTQLVSEHASEDELPDPDVILFDTKNNKFSDQKATTSAMLTADKVKPVFSVFEKLEDEDLAHKKYSELNKAVKKIHPYQKDCAVLVRRNLSESFKMCSKNTSEINRRVSSKTNAISKELRTIEKEKWKNHYLRSENIRRPSQKLRCCKRYGKNRYNSSDTVNVGKYFCQKRYSDNYKELSSISKSLRQKPKFGEKDIVILNTLKKNVQTCSKDPNAADSCNIQYSGITNHPSSSKTSNSKKYTHHDIISFDKEGLLGLASVEARRALRATLCLSNIKNLDVQKDGLICLNWQKQ